jgi:Domain of unknown function (DUF4265)
VVETETRDGHQHLVARVAEPSGRFALRVWFLDASIASELSERLTAIGALLEWRGDWSRLVAVDAADEAMTRTVAEALRPYEETKQLNFETGWR